MDRVVSGNRVLALIQARGGSQGIPRKNLSMLDGHPLVAYSIASARAASSVSRVVVSTDDEEIAGVCARYGAEVPFVRPSELAQADTIDWPVFQHALAWLAEHEQYEPELVVQLRPTSPLRPRGLIDAAVSRLAADPAADSVRAVTRASQNPYKMWRPGSPYLVPLMQGEFEEPFNMPRQQLPPVFWQTGHIDVIRRETIAAGSMTGTKILPIEVEAKYCLDIDSPGDLDLAAWTLTRGNLDIDRPAFTMEHTRGTSR